MFGDKQTIGDYLLAGICLGLLVALTEYLLITGAIP